MKTIYREPGEIVNWIAYVKQNNVAVEIKLGKFGDWNSAFECAKTKFGSDKIVLIEPE